MHCCFALILLLNFTFEQNMLLFDCHIYVYHARLQGWSTFGPSLEQSRTFRHNHILRQSLLTVENYWTRAVPPNQHHGTIHQGYESKSTPPISKISKRHHKNSDLFQLYLDRFAKPQIRAKYSANRGRRQATTNCWWGSKRPVPAQYVSSPNKTVFGDMIPLKCSIFL